MSRSKKILGVGLLIIAVLLISGEYLSRVSIPVLEPKGPIADKEFRLMIVVTLIMLIVVVPVFVLLAYILVRYNENNKKPTKYSPDWDHSRIIEGIWWLVPSLIIGVLAVITWKSTYALNPYNPIPSPNKTITIDVVSLDWKWLFIYPKQSIASVDKLVFPVKTPVHFYLTSDAPMNSFWLPQLSGQIYTMAGMQTQLYIMADVRGDFIGRSANISGIGFSGMVFHALATSKQDFSSWVTKTKLTSPSLTISAYDNLSKPSLSYRYSLYSNPAPNLFNDIINKYMNPADKGVVI